MTRARRRVSHKHFRLDASKIRHAQKLMRTGTETETIERALDLVIAQEECNRRIAMSAARQGITVVTANARDLAKLAEFRPFEWKLHSAA